MDQLNEHSSDYEAACDLLVCAVDNVEAGDMVHARMLLRTAPTLCASDEVIQFSRKLSRRTWPHPATFGAVLLLLILVVIQAILAGL